MKLLNNYNVGKRLYMVFGLILILTLGNLIYNIINLEASKQSVIEINSSLNSIDYLIEADRDAYQSNIAISLALHPENFKDAEKLSGLIKDIDENKAQVLERYTKFSELFNVKESANTVKSDEAFRSNFTKLASITDSITGYLKSGNDSTAAFLYFTKYNNYFKPMRAALNDFTDIHLEESANSFNNNIALNKSSKINSIIIFLIIVVVFFSSGYTLRKSISNPLIDLKKVVSEMSEGKLPEVRIYGNDEIAQMGSYISKLTDGLQKTATFAQDIGNGNLNAEFVPLSEQDVLGHSLIQMKSNLAKFAKEEEQRSWSTNGIANLGDILRNTKLDAEALYANTLTFIIKYMNANQGGLFIINNEIESEPYIEMVAAYAYNRKKFLNKKLNFGEGLVGQAVLERDIIYMTEIPNDYVNITSGLGDACPTNLLIVPLMNNEEVFGVIEIASFHKFSDFEIDFVKKISEGIASTISSVKVNEKTKRLLETSQQMTEELRAQEEEMRQNMEELHATQEEMARKHDETEAQYNELKKKLNQEIKDRAEREQALLDEIEALKKRNKK